MAAAMAEVASPARERFQVSVKKAYVREKVVPELVKTWSADRAAKQTANERAVYGLHPAQWPKATTVRSGYDARR